MMPLLLRALAATAALVGWPLPSADAQLATARDSVAPDSAARLAPVRVTVTRERGRSVLELPFALSRVEIARIRPALRRSQLPELLFALPGVTTASRNNPSQDPRLSIRGFGARSAFGVRGIRVLRDGIPLTVADGQTPVDLLDLETAGSVELLRGSAAALYGNATGGVLDVRSETPAAVPLSAWSRVWRGGGLTRATAALGGATRAADSRYQLALTRTEGTGARAYSRLRSTSLFGDAHATIGRARTMFQLIHFDLPVAQNPGALTAAELAATPRGADPQSVARGARKAARQTQVGTIVSHPVGAGTVSVMAFGTTRALDNPQPFAVVDLARDAWGSSVRWEQGEGRKHGDQPASARRWRIAGGVDWLGQADARRNFENCLLPGLVFTPTRACPARAERGALRLDQTERVTSLGSFLRGELAIGPALLATGAVRADRLRFALEDRFVTSTDRDDSGVRTLGAVTPMLGLAGRVSTALRWYANVSTAFETPTVTELANQPDGSAGLNRNLEPQRSRSAEVGVKGIARVLRYDLALFGVDARDELIGYDVPNGGGRRFFRNAGRTRRLGTEASFGLPLGVAELGGAWSWSRFRYASYEVNGTRFDGNRLPGIPSHQLQLFGTLRLRGSALTVEAQHASRTPADDANTVYGPEFTIANVRAEGTLERWGIALAPMGGVENLFDRRYAPSLVTNASRGRYFEPGPGRTWFAGARVLRAGQ